MLMKKLYLIALATATALSASATANKQIVEITAGTTESAATLHRPEKVAESYKPLTIEKILPKDMASTKAANADYDYSTTEWETLGEGQYYDGFICPIYSQTNTAVTVTIEVAKDNPSLYRVVNPWPSVVASDYLIIDASDPEFVIVPKQRTLIEDSVDGVTDIASISWVALDYNLTKDVFLANFSEYNIYMQDKVIYFPAESAQVQWPEAPEDSEYGTDATEWYTYQKEQGYLQLPGGQVTSQWESIGTGKIFEGFLCTVFGKTAGEYDVEILKHTQSEGVYKVKNAYGLSFSSNADLVLDASDPSNVIFELQTTGVTATGRGETYIMSYSYNYTEAEMAENYPTKFITLSDGKVNIPVQSVYLHWPDFEGYENSIFNNSYAVESWIQIPSNGVEGVEIDDDTDAPVEYFNLQGIKVDKPSSGLYIRRQGSTTTKVAIK